MSTLVKNIIELNDKINTSINKQKEKIDELEEKIKNMVPKPWKTKLIIKAQMAIIENYSSDRWYKGTSYYQYTISGSQPITFNVEFEKDKYRQQGSSTWSNIKGDGSISTKGLQILSVSSNQFESYKKY